MSWSLRNVEHSDVVDAPAERLYDLVSDVTRWPVIFGPCVYARRLEQTDDAERIELWAQTNGQVKSWTSRRVLDAAGHRVSFRQERTAAPIAAMSGEWSFPAVGDERTKMLLKHGFSAVDDDAGALEWITTAVDRNSVQELNALGRVAALDHPVDDIVFSFEDRLEIPGASAARAYDFVSRSDLWPQRLPHVDHVDLRESPGGVQEMTMDTVTPDGLRHTTKSIRVCFPRERIVYKQTILPDLLSGHSGVWEFADVAGQLVISSRHTVAVDPSAIDGVLGPGTTLAAARDYIRGALGANSRTTMSAAGEYAARAAYPA